MITLVSVFFLFLVTAFAEPFRMMNGKLQYKLFGEWQDYSMGNSGTSYSESTYDSDFQRIAKDLGVMSASSGGITKAELDFSLTSFLGSVPGSFNFRKFQSGNTGTQVSIPISSVIEAIAENQNYASMYLGEALRYYLYLDDGFDQYLSSSGQIATVPTSADGRVFSLATMLGNGLRGLNTNMLSSFESARLDYSALLTKLADFKDANHTDVTAFQALTHSDVLAFKDANHVDLTSGFSTNHSDLTAFKSQAHSDSEELHWDLRTLDGDLQSYVGGTFSDPSNDMAFEAFTDHFQFTPWLSSSASLSEYSYDGEGVMGLMLALGVPVQSDLAKLRYVLASDEDIEISKKQAPVKDAVSDSFAGEGPAAVKPADVGDLAGISGDIQGAFSTGANAADVVGALNNSDNWSFFSADTAARLNTVPVPATASDDGDDGFINFYDPSVLEAYLSGGD